MQQRAPLGGQRLANQKNQRVLCLRPQAHLRLEVGGSLLLDAFGLANVELSAHAVIELQLRDSIRLVSRLERIARDGQLVVIRDHGQILVRDLRHERYFRRLVIRRHSGWHPHRFFQVRQP